MSGLLELADRVEAATGPDAALDADIADAVHWDNPITFADDDRLLSFTASLDAALTLVPAGWDVTSTRSAGGKGCAEGSHPDQVFMVETQWCANPALALTAAALRAIAASTPGEAA